ncbi:MAG: hypothetical protein LBT56_00590 [Prevotellaceae bacterium]|nr:hypothetical protein [Prevotellaceae bacterium]
MAIQLNLKFLRYAERGKKTMYNYRVPSTDYGIPITEKARETLTSCTFFQLDKLST